MMAVIAAMYSATDSLVTGTAVFTANLGVRYGSPISRLMFIHYVNDFIQLIKQNYENDGFLKSFHTLIILDDTVLLSTLPQG